MAYNKNIHHRRSIRHKGYDYSRAGAYFVTICTQHRKNIYGTDIRWVKQFGWARFDKKLLQRDYWEHIIRNEPELNRIRHYIANNPAKWESDKLYGNDDSTELNSTIVCEPIVEYEKEGWMV